MSAAIIVSLIIIIAFLLLLLLGAFIDEKDLKERAVRRGYAEWIVIDEGTGETEFRWLDKPKDSLPADH